MHLYGEKMKVKSDRADQIEKEWGAEVKPVDMYGKCVFPDKNDSKNLEHAREDIKEFYDLEGDAGLKGGE